MSAALRIAFAILALGLVVLILIALPGGDGGAAINFLTATPWGRVTTADLYIGFILSGALVIAFERNVLGVVLAVAILLLGNVVTALWFAWRWPELAKLILNRRAAR